jgi:hypothetical protein
MNTPEAQPDPIVLAQNELIALLEPKTGPITDLRLRPVDGRGAFQWTATQSESGETVTGTCAVKIVALGDGISVEITATIDEPS